MKKEKPIPASPLVFQGRMLPTAITSLIAFIGGGAGMYVTMEDQQPSLIQAQENITIQTCFTPRNSCQPLLIKAIHEAKHTIYMHNYSFTAKPLADALIEAHNRGVHIQIISDKGQVREQSVVKQLAQLGITIYIDKKVAIAHNKIIIIDEKQVITGSYNFSMGAENRNAENLLFVSSPDLAKQYLDNWRYRQLESILLERKKE